MRRVCWTLLVALSAGCFSTDLDPTLGGVFACGRAADGAECPDEQTCSNDRCQPDEIVPTVTIDSPLPGAVSTFIPDLGATVSSTFVFRAENLTLVDPASNSEHVYGEGHVVVSLDGIEQATLVTGELGAGRELVLDVPNTAGAHRFSVELVRNDGEPYDHQGAAARELFWFDDGMPRVALTKPWPGQAFPLDETRIECEIGVLNFRIASAQTTGFVFRQGHGHVHYDDPFPECPDDSNCDVGYIAITDDPVSASGRMGAFGSTREGAGGLLPDEPSSRTAEVSVVLRHISHPPYRLPDTGDDGAALDPFEPPMTGPVITDTITIERK